MRKLQASGLALCLALGGRAGVAHAGLFSSTPVIAILDGELLVGEVTAHLAGWGTIALRSLSNAAACGQGAQAGRQQPGARRRNPVPAPLIYALFSTAP